MLKFINKICDFILVLSGIILYLALINILFLFIPPNYNILNLAPQYKFDYVLAIFYILIIIVITIVVKHISSLYKPIKNSSFFVYQYSKGLINKNYKIAPFFKNSSSQIIQQLADDLLDKAIPQLLSEYGSNIEFTIETHLIAPKYISYYEEKLQQIKNKFPGLEYKIKPIRSFSRTFNTVLYNQPVAVIIWLIKKLKGIHDKFPWIINKQWYEITFINRQSTSNPPPSHPKT